MKKISVVVPLGEGSNFDALNSLKKQKDKIECIVETGPNPSRNRNRGAKKAKTDFVAFINGHTLLANNWVEQVQDFFAKHPTIDIVGGAQLTPVDDAHFGKISGYALSSVFGAGGIAKRYKISKLDLDADETKITSANLICRKKVLKKIKFDETLWPGEDPKFIADAKRNGFKIACSPDIIVYNRRRGNMKGLVKQVFGYGLMRPRKEKFRETLTKPFFLVPSIFIIYLIFFGLLSILNVLFIFPILFYIFLSGLFSIYESMKNKNVIALFLLPWIFFNIHVSYGLGFLYGTVISKRKKL